MNEQNLFETLQRKSTGENLWMQYVFFKETFLKLIQG